LSDFASRLEALERRTDEALGSLEQEQRWAEALAVYQAAGAELDALHIPRADPAFRPGRRLRAYLFLREANALRALGRPAEAAPLGEQELTAALASGHGLSIARAMFSLGTTCLTTGQAERGLQLLADARPMFEHGDDLEHRQALGWWYVVQADLSNAGLTDAPPGYALECARQALEILRPIENRPGIARAYAARAAAHERLGNAEAARIARAAQAMAEVLIGQSADRSEARD
jgi:hypothetical protein